MTALKRKGILYLLSGALLAVILLLSSCGEGQTEKSYDYLVTFNYNIGSLDATCPDQYLGVKSGGLVGIQPGFSDDFRLSPVSGYYIEGWYTAKLDSDGNPRVDSGTGRVILDRKWSFESDKVSADMTLYANLLRQSNLLYVDIETGETVMTSIGTPGGTLNKPMSLFAPKKEGYTLLGYYKDAEKTEAFAWPFTYTDGDSRVYVDFIEGDWTIVSTADEMKNAIASGENIYLASDIDFTGKTWVSTKYNAKTEGNGHTVSGITLNTEGNRNKKSGFSLFTTLGENAEFRNVTFDGVSVTFRATLMGEYKVALLAEEIKTGAKFDHFTLNGTLTYDIAAAPTSTVAKVAVTDGTRAEDITDSVFNVTLRDING